MRLLKYLVTPEPAPRDQHTAEDYLRALSKAVRPVRVERTPADVINTYEGRTFAQNQE